MNTNIITLVTSLVIIALAVAVSIVFDTRKLQRLNFIFLLIVVISGLGFYSFGLNNEGATVSDAILNAFRTIGYTISMFGGGEKFDALMKVEGWFSASIFWQLAYWLIHLLAVYVTASTLLITWGKKLISRLKLLIPARNIAVIYCDDERKFDYLSQLEKQKSTRIIYVDSYSKDLENRLADYTVEFLSSEDMKTDGRWLKRHMLIKKNKQISVFCFTHNDGKAEQFIRKSVDSFNSLGISSHNVRIYVMGENIQNYRFVNDLCDVNGLHFITEAYTAASYLATRLVLSEMPHTTMKFDYETCQATSNFNSMVIGFGDVGQDVLRQLVSYGQFLGSRFICRVIDTEGDGCGGLFKEIYGEMLRRYDISFHNINAFSSDLYSLFSEKEKMNYVVVSAGKEKANREIISQLLTYRMVHPECFSDNAVIATCSKDRLEVYRNGEQVSVISATSIDGLISNRPDMLARHINDIEYRERVEKRDNSQVDSSQLQEAWYRKSLYDRESSRASAQYLPAFIACSGTQEKKKSEVEKLISEKLIHILPELEHIRWNGYMAASGVSQMSHEEFADNLRKLDTLIGKALETEDEKDLKQAENWFGLVRKNIGPEVIGGKHVCLTDWQDLEIVWNMYLPSLLRYNEMLEKFGENPVRVTDFRELDEKNVYHMLDIIS